MEKKQEIIDRHIAALNNIKIVIEKTAMSFKEHYQLQEDIALLAKTIAAHLAPSESEEVLPVDEK